MCCLSWLSALFNHLGWHSSNAAEPLSQELQDRTSSDNHHGYRTLESMPQPSTISTKQGSVCSVEILEPKSSTPPLFSEHLISSAENLASTFQTAQPLDHKPQLPTATLNRDSIDFVEESAFMPSAPKITVRSIKYSNERLQSAEIAYSIDQRRSWHWLPYERLVEKWGEDGIRKFNPRFNDGL